MIEYQDGMGHRRSGVCGPEHGVASATYAVSERIAALSDARAHLMAEHTPGKVTDEWLNWVDMETQAAKKLGWE